MARPKKIEKFESRKTFEEKKLEIQRSFFEAVTLQKNIDLDDWSDLYRFLSQGSAAEFGPWKTSRFPFHRKIMKALSPSSRAKTIVWAKGSQVGATEVAICLMLYSPDCDPGGFVYTQKTEDAVKDFSNQKFKSAIRDCARVAHLLGDKKPAGYNDSYDNKTYPGGFISLGAANSTTFLRSKSVSRACVDEEDSYELSIGDEGSPIFLLGKRMATFQNRKLFRPSTPVHKELSTIWPAFEAGSMEYYYLPCPNCNHKANLDEGNMFKFEWELIHWGEEINPETNSPFEVGVDCPYCKDRIMENRWKTWMLNHGDWFSTKGNEEGQRPYRVGDVENPSFHTSALYSPVGFFSWHDAVSEWFTYLRERRTEILQVFINCTLGLTFSLETNEIGLAHIINRREDYSEEKIPPQVLLITAGVDIQQDRIELQTIGWHFHNELFGIEYISFPGNPELPYDPQTGFLTNGQPSVWKLLDDYLSKMYRHPSGKLLPIEVTMIDSKYATTAVHEFCKWREYRRIFPIQGKDGWGKGSWSVSKRRHELHGTYLYTAYTDELKSIIYSQLQLSSAGPGFCHYPNTPNFNAKFFRGLTCEKKEPKTINGHTRLAWIKPDGARNEPLDTTVYAYVAKMAYPVDFEVRAAQLK